MWALRWTGVIAPVPPDAMSVTLSCKNSPLRFGSNRVLFEASVLVTYRVAVAGSTATSKLLVPTSETVEETAPVFAFRIATSTSAKENPGGRPASQILGVGNPSSTQCDPFHCTITPTAGAAGSEGSLGGLGGEGPPSAVTRDAPTIEVRFPPFSTVT